MSVQDGSSEHSVFRIFIHRKFVEFERKEKGGFLDFNLHPPKNIFSCG